jgi:hypothetical protein
MWQALPVNNHLQGHAVRGQTRGSRAVLGRRVVGGGVAQHCGRRVVDGRVATVDTTRRSTLASLWSTLIAATPESLTQIVTAPVRPSTSTPTPMSPRSPCTVRRAEL